MFKCRHLQASSLGFDGKPAQKRAFPDANGESRASVDRPDYSTFAQQKRSSVELGMGNISHAANINPGGSSEPSGLASRSSQVVAHLAGWCGSACAQRNAPCH